MFQKKTFLDALAALGTGAVLLAGCGGSDKPVNAPEVPAAQPEAPAAAAPEAAPAVAPVEATSGDNAAGTSTGSGSAAPATAASGDDEATPSKTQLEFTYDGGRGKAAFTTEGGRRVEVTLRVVRVSVAG